jgi:Glu-tRNA(Gln) amidotransferase subunit E-like FAD-binding protein
MTEQDLIDHYQRQVDQIPDIRPLVTLHEEVMLKIITHLVAYHHKGEDDNALMKECMSVSRGHMNPTMVKDAIKQWKETT